MTQTLRTMLACTMLASASVACAQAGGGANSTGTISASAPVRTQQGLIQGAPGKVAGVTVFKNIPFAAPPVGDLRWRLRAIQRAVQVQPQLSVDHVAEPVVNLAVPPVTYSAAARNGTVPRRVT